MALAGTNNDGYGFVHTVIAIRTEPPLEAPMTATADTFGRPIARRRRMAPSEIPASPGVLMRFGRRWHRQGDS